MTPFMKKFIKSTLAGFAVGLVLSLILPHVANLIGDPTAVGVLSRPLWASCFFAAISGAGTLVAPLFDGLFGDKEKSGAEQPVQAEEAGRQQSAGLTIQPGQDKTKNWAEFVNAKAMLPEETDRRPKC